MPAGVVVISNKSDLPSIGDGTAGEIVIAPDYVIKHPGIDHETVARYCSVNYPDFDGIAIRPGTELYYQYGPEATYVIAADKNGVSAYVTAPTATALSGATKPSVSWTAENNETVADGILIYRSEIPSELNDVSKLDALTEVAANITEFVDTSAVASVYYFYKIVPYNSLGKAESNIAGAIQVLSSPPGAVTLNGGDQITDEVPSGGTYDIQVLDEADNPIGAVEVEGLVRVTLPAQTNAINTNYDTSSQAYFDEVANRGGLLTDEFKDLHNNIVVTAKALNLWDRIIFLNPCAGGNAAAAAIDAKNVGVATHEHVFEGAPTFLPNYGVQFNGIDQYSRNGFIPNDSPVDAAWFAMGVAALRVIDPTVNAGVDRYYYGVRSLGTSYRYAMLWNFNDALEGRMFNNAQLQNLARNQWDGFTIAQLSRRRTTAVGSLGLDDDGTTGAYLFGGGNVWAADINHGTGVNTSLELYYGASNADGGGAEGFAAYTMGYTFAINQCVKEEYRYFARAIENLNLTLGYR